MLKLTPERAKRLVSLGRKIWKILTREEQEIFYNDIGTVEFVVLVGTLLHIDVNGCSLEEFDDVHDTMFENTKLKR